MRTARRTVTRSFLLMLGLTIGEPFLLASPVGATVPDGVVGWWPGEANAVDVLGPHDGDEIGGATHSTGAVGEGFSLDGVDDAVVIPDAPELDPPSDAITIEAWIRVDGFTSSLGPILTKHAPNQKAWVLSVRSDGGLRFAIYHEASGGVRHVDTPASVVPIGTFQHVAATFDVATQDLRVYLNGAPTQADLISTATIPELADTAADVRIGNLTGTSFFFQGVIDEPTLYDRALEAGEVNAIFAAGSAGKCSPTTFPGSGEDFRLRTGVDGPADNVTTKAIVGGSALTIALDSPGGTFVGAPAVLSYQLFPTGTPPAGTPGNPLLAHYHLDLLAPPPFQAVVHAVSIPALSATGDTFAVPMPQLPLSGVSLMLQALVIGPAAENGTVGFSEARVLELVPAVVYVDGAAGNDANPGTQTSPVRTLQEGMEQAGGALPGSYSDVHVAWGNYFEDVHLDRSISLRGGYDPSTWTYTSGNRSLVVGSNRVLQVRDVHLPTTLSGFEFQASNGVAPPAAGPFDMQMASIAADIRDCSVDLRFESCWFTAATGAHGPSGASATIPGDNGTDGAMGEGGYLTLDLNYQPQGGLGGAGAQVGGKGGNGGEPGNAFPFVPGLDGKPGQDGGGGCSSGGAGALGTWMFVTLPGGDATPTPTQPAATGNPGIPQTPGGTVNAIGDWIPGRSTAGESGADGCGGGGGGGGGATKGNTGILVITQYWMSGGGGGGGGAGGAGGTGGAGGVDGGASLAAYLFDASPLFHDCTFVAGAGGNGGSGGNGSAGGYGGAGRPGGSGFSQTLPIPGIGNVLVGSGDGGAGADGQDGGAGGGGAGANGGPSWCAFTAGTSAPPGLQSDPTNAFFPNQGGAQGFGGFGGSNPASDGQPGPSGKVGS